MLNKREKTTGFLVNSGVFFVIIACFFIPLSTSIMGISAGLVVLFWVLSGRVFRLPQLVGKCPVSFFSLLLFLLFFIGVFYSPVGYEEAFDTLKKYRELLYIPAVIGLMEGNRKGYDWDDWNNPYVSAGKYWDCLYRPMRINHRFDKVDIVLFGGVLMVCSSSR